MPYIKQEDRLKFKDTLPEIIEILKANGSQPGEINYVISNIIWNIFDETPSYTLANNLVGVLECVKQEFIRRRLNEYEDHKILINGDI